MPACRRRKPASPRKGAPGTGAAWLSSARVVRCWVKSRNERNPCGRLPQPEGGNPVGGSRPRLPCETGRKVGTTSSQDGPYGQGCTRTTMPSTERGPKPQGGGNRAKAGPSSDWGLQLAPMKPESLVMAHQPRRREYVPGPCTHRPSHHGSRWYPKRLSANLGNEGAGPEGMSGNWDEVVTR